MTAVPPPSSSSTSSPTKPATSAPSYLRKTASSIGMDTRAAQADTNRLLSEMAPHLMTPAMVNALARVSLQAGQLSTARDPFPLQRATLLLAPRFSMDNPARSLARISSSILQFSGLGKNSRSENGKERTPMTSMDIGVLEESQRILEHANEDLDMSLDTDLLDGETMEDDVPVSLLRGYEATVPQASINKVRRRKLRATAKVKRRDKDQHLLSLEELEVQDQEVQEEMRHLEIRRALYNSEIVNVDAKIAALEATKAQLQQKLLSVREEELELEDECTWRRD
ncbi:Mitochondrial fission protein [Malassezia pachydermatis]